MRGPNSVNFLWAEGRSCGKAFWVERIDGEAVLWLFKAATAVTRKRKIVRNFIFV